MSDANTFFHLVGSYEQGYSCFKKMEQEEFVLSFVAVFFAPLQLLFSFETITFFETLKVFFFQDLGKLFFFDLPFVVGRALT